MITIRGFKEKDAETCTKIANEAFQAEIQRGMPSFTSEYFTKQPSRKGVKLVVAEREQVVGFMLVTHANGLVPAQVHLVAVDVGSRGHGIGKKLVQHAVDYVVENGWSKLKLSTRPWNTGMRKICVALNFIPEAYLRKEYLNEDLIQYGYFP